MEILIKKCPNIDYLRRGTFSVSQREFDLIQTHPKDVVINLYNGEDNSLFKTIKGRDLKKLIATPRQTQDEDGIFGSFYVIDFSGVK